MLDNIKEMIEKAFSAIITWNKEDANIVINIEQNVDNLEDLYRKRHILRINEGKCDVSELDYYVDILSNLERIGDHADNIANNVINDEYMATTITGLHE
jgi:phosphate:Na+ symporter